MVSVATTQLCHPSSEAATDDMWMVGVAVLPENVASRTSLVVQWLRIRLSMQGTVLARSTYTKIGTIQRRLAWPLRKDDTQIREAFHIFIHHGRLLSH